MANSAALLRSAFFIPMSRKRVGPLQVRISSKMAKASEELFNVRPSWLSMSDAGALN